MPTFGHLQQQHHHHHHNYHYHQRHPLVAPLSESVSTSDIKKGMTIELDGEPYKVLSFSIMKQARGAAKTTIKFKNLLRGSTVENTYRSGMKFETALIEKKNYFFSFREENTLTFLDTETFEEVFMDASSIKDGMADWITNGMEVTLVFFGKKIVEVILPQRAIYEIVETGPVEKASTKAAVLSCGVTITVPGYLQQGESVLVDTERKSFLERA